MLARLLERQHPELVVSDMKKTLRTGKVLVDWSQNDDHKTTVCVYSLRARERPTVSTPVKWDEVESCCKKGDPDLLVFDSNAVLERVKKQGDLFASVLKLKQKMPPLGALQQMEAQTGSAVVVSDNAGLAKTKAGRAHSGKSRSAKKSAPSRKRG